MKSSIPKNKDVRLLAYATNCNIENNVIIYKKSMRDDTSFVYLINVVDGNNWKIDLPRLYKLVKQDYINVQNLQLCSNGLKIINVYSSYSIVDKYILSMLEKHGAGKKLKFITVDDIESYTKKATLLEFINILDYNTLRTFDIEGMHYIMISNNTKVLTNSHSIIVVSNNSFKYSKYELSPMEGIDYKFKSIDFSNVELLGVRDLNYMFSWARYDELDLSGFDTSRIEKMNFIFDHSKIKKLNMSSFTSDNLKSAIYMFNSSEIDELDIRSFEIKNIDNIEKIFYHSIIHRIILNSKYKKDKVTLSILNSLGGVQIEFAD